jgi:hypothetical protein
MQNKMKDRIKFMDLENHLNEWFGNDWSNQSSTQILAMTMSLLGKVGVEILSEKDLKNECELNAFENQSNEC